MKYSGSSFIFTTILLAVLLLPQEIKATTSVEISNNGEGASSNVNVKTNTGGNTVCVNGKCTTTNENNGTSTVCINGNCQTSENGSLNVQSEDGKSKVEIENNSSSVKVEQNSLGASTEEKEKKKAKEVVDSAKQNLEEGEFDIKEFVSKQLEFLRKIVTFQFLFGSK